MARDRALEEKLSSEEHKRTLTLRAASQERLEQIKKLRASRDEAIHAAIATVRRIFIPQREAMRERQKAERAALKDKQSRFRARLMRILDITGISRSRQEAARKLLARRHKQQRHELSTRYRENRLATERKLRSDYVAGIVNAQNRRKAELAGMQQRFAEVNRFAEHERQQREVEREHARRLVEAKIQDWNKTRVNEGPLGVESDFAKAMKRAAEHETRRSTGRAKDGDIDRDR